MTHADLFETIERVLPEGGDWCSRERACALASIVLALRPRHVLEIGVWLGGSAIPMMLALDYVRRLEPDVARSFIAIDPWSAGASMEGQDPVNAEWWGKVDHEAAYQGFVARLARHELAGLCRVIRKRSDDVHLNEDKIPVLLDVLSIDGNHAEQAIRDVSKFAPSVRVGGILALDDVNWSSGCVAAARELAFEIGFIERYAVDNTAILERVT